MQRDLQGETCVTHSSERKCPCVTHVGSAFVFPYSNPSQVSVYYQIDTHNLESHIGKTFWCIILVIFARSRFGEHTNVKFAMIYVRTRESSRDLKFVTVINSPING